MGRFYRIGQQHKVFGRRFFCRGTDRGADTRETSREAALVRTLIDSDRPDPAMMGLSEEEVFQLFKNLNVRPASP